MTKATVISAAASLLGLATSTQAATLFADGGFQTTTNSACLSSWEYKFEDKTVRQVSGCVSITQLPPYPYVGTGSATVEGLRQPLDVRTDKTKWCATGDRYNAFNDLAEKREIWGYCLDKSLPFPTPAPTLGSGVTAAPTVGEEEPFQFDLDNGQYAEGGFATQPVECLTTWRYKNKNENIDEEVSGCIPFDDLMPWPFATEDANAIAGAHVKTPVDSRTTTASWCATRDVYNPFPDRDITNRESWGYCLQVGTKAPTKQPTTVPPTKSPTVPPTVAAPTTRSPTGTTSAPSRSPTQFPTEFIFEYEMPTTVPIASPTAAVTHAPTKDEGRPAPNDGTQGSKENVGTYAGIGVAGVLVIIALVLAVMFVQSMYKSKHAAEAKNATKKQGSRVKEEKEDIERQERTSQSDLF